MNAQRVVFHVDRYTSQGYRADYRYVPTLCAALKLALRWTNDTTGHYAIVRSDSL